jgi:3-oxoacyl-[acyl-carrier protein] reductase
VDLGLKNRTALVLGASGGLGGAIATALAAEGARVAVAGRSREAVDRTVAAITEVGGQAIGLTWDLADLSAIEPNVRRVESELGPVDILVNNTGGPPPTPVAGQSAEAWRQQFEAMVLSVITLTDRVLPGMKERGWGRIITSTSSGVVAPIPNLGMSNTLRMSLVGWSKTLASEVGRHGITVNVILPGRIATSRIRFLDEKKAEREGRDVADVVKDSTGAIPLGRYGDPQEYGDAAAFLASERASYITGSVLRIDGGYIPSV